MSEYKDCPNCGGRSTKQHIEHEPNMMRVIRTCDECPTEFVVNYGNPFVGDVVKL